MARERVDGTQRHSEARLSLNRWLSPVRPKSGRDRSSERDGVALEVAVVDPDRVQPCVAGSARPVHDFFGIAARGQAEADRAGERTHRGAPWRESRSRLDHTRSRLDVLPAGSTFFVCSGGAVVYRPG